MTQYFIYDAENAEMYYKKTEEEALKLADEVIHEGLEDGEWVERPHVYIGIVTHQTVEKKVSIRPEPDQLDEEGYAPDGYNYDNDYDAYYDYVIENVED